MSHMGNLRKNNSGIGPKVQKKPKEMVREAAEGEICPFLRGLGEKKGG